MNAELKRIYAELAEVEEETASDMLNNNTRTSELSNAVACGYVTYKDGNYVKAEGEPDWKHPSLRTPEENERALKRALRKGA